MLSIMQLSIFAHIDTFHTFTGKLCICYNKYEKDYEPVKMCMKQ